MPRPENPARSKVTITSRSLGVCKKMRTDTEMMAYTLDKDECWQLFVKSAGAVAKLEHIQPLAKEIVRVWWFTFVSHYYWNVYERLDKSRAMGRCFEIT